MQLLSVNVGRPRPNPWKRLAATGIDKRPVEGPVAVRAPGPKGTGASSSDRMSFMSSKAIPEPFEALCGAPHKSSNAQSSIMRSQPTPAPGLRGRRV